MVVSHFKNSSVIKVTDLLPSCHHPVRAGQSKSSKELPSLVSSMITTRTPQQRRRPTSPRCKNATISLISHCFIVQLFFVMKMMMVSGSEIVHDPRLRGGSQSAPGVEMLAPESRSDEEIWKVPAACDHSNRDIYGMNKKVKDRLLQRGYSVREGRFVIGQSSNNASNKDTPYFVYVLDNESERMRLPIFKLKPSSAVLFLGCTPSSAKYFSFRSYAFTSERANVFASLGDSTNNLMINTTQSGAYWNGEQNDPNGKLTAIVTTADGQTFSTVTQALDEAGAPSGIVNLDAIPSSKVNLFNDRSLTFMMLHRATLWEDESQKRAYFTQNRRILLIDPPSDQEFDPLPEIPLRKRGSGNPEAEQPGVQQGLAELHDAILASMQSSSYTLISNTTLDGYDIDGFECLQDRTSCMGDNRDTLYIDHVSGENFIMKDVYVFVGTNSVATGKCTYNAIGLYEVTVSDTGDLVSPKSTKMTLDTRDMENSASSFGVDNDKLIAYTMARDCNKVPDPFNEHCLEVEYNNRTGIPAEASWGFIYRTVLDPETKTAPLPSDLIMPRFLKFQV